MTRAAREILIRPLMTEKSMRQKEEHNAVAFRVRPDANKVEIRAAVEAVFNVRSRRSGPRRSRGSSSGWDAFRADGGTGRRRL